MGYGEFVFSEQKGGLACCWSIKNPEVTETVNQIFYLVKHRVCRSIQGFHYHFQQEGNWFSQVGKAFLSELVRWSDMAGKSFSQSINLSCLVSGC